MLGLLTAARGGLTARDLAELADVPRCGMSRRSCTPRRGGPSPAGPATGLPSRPEVYLLGHEELQAAATAYLGEDGLSATGTALHAWADAGGPGAGRRGPRSTFCAGTSGSWRTWGTCPV